jgi:hypothetical protein
MLLRAQVEACVVRVMKSRKELPHVQLVTEARAPRAGRPVACMLVDHTARWRSCRSSRFCRSSPDPRLIKSRINDLNQIEREYLARKEDDATTYVYKAWRGAAGVYVA